MTYKSISTVIRGIMYNQAPNTSITEEAPAEIVDVHPETTEAPAEPTAAEIVAKKYLHRSAHQRQQIQKKIIDNA